MPNPLVYMDISIANKPSNRIIIELFTDTTPKMAENFRLLCTGEKGREIHYKGSEFYNVVPTRCQGGALNLSKPQLNSIYSFGPENFTRKHYGPGTVSMVSSNGPDFFISSCKMPVLDGTFVVVGRVFKGISVVNDVMNVGSLYGNPKSRVVITDCGEHREPLVSPISASQKMSIKEPSVSQKMSSKELLVTPISASQKMSSKEPLVTPISASQKKTIKQPLVSPISASQKMPIKEPLVLPISGSLSQKMPIKESLVLPMSASQKISIKGPIVSPVSAPQKILIKEPIVSPISAPQKILIKEPLVSPVSTSQKTLIKEPIISPTTQARTMSVKEYEKVISTSSAQLSNTLKELINAKKQMTGVDDKDVLILGSEKELEEVAGILEHNLKPLMDFKAEVCSLEKHQNDLLSQTRARISNIKKTKRVLEMIPSFPYEDLVNIENAIKKRKSN